MGDAVWVSICKVDLRLRTLSSAKWVFLTRSKVDVHPPIGLQRKYGAQIQTGIAIAIGIGIETQSKSGPGKN
jgi:hypothetical protein